MSNLIEKIKKHMEIGSKVCNTTPEINTSMASPNLKEIKVDIDMEMEEGIIDEDIMTPRVFDRTKKGMGVKNFVMNKSENKEKRKEINAKNDEYSSAYDSSSNRSMTKRARKGNAKESRDYVESHKDSEAENIENAETVENIGSVDNDEYVQSGENGDSGENDQNDQNGQRGFSPGNDDSVSTNERMDPPEECGGIEGIGNSNHGDECGDEFGDKCGDECGDEYGNEHGNEHGNEYSMEKEDACPFVNITWQTPKKSNVGLYYSGIDNPSTLKKYKTPCEMDMLHPDESLIGNKCITINNYVNPPKYVAPTVTPSKFPLSGENNPHMTYEDFRCLFKHKACIISEHEFNNNKLSNRMDNSDRKYIECFNSGYENNSWPNKKEVAPSISKMSSTFFTNSKDSPKCKKRKGDGSTKLSTKKILNVLVGGEKGKNECTKLGNHNNMNHSISNSISRSISRSISHSISPSVSNSVSPSVSPSASNNPNIGDKYVSGKYGKKGKIHVNEEEEENFKKKEKKELIDYEINPIINTEKENINNEPKSMEEMSKQKQNPLIPLYEPYSKELDVIFNKSIIKTPILLLNIYQYLLVVIARRNQKNEPIFYQLIKQEVINLNPCRCFSEELLKQLAWIAPNLIQLNKVVITKDIYESNQQIYTEYITGKKIEDIQIREHTENCENIYKYTSADKLEMLKRIIISWANIKHNELLKKINPDFYCAKYSELKKWHSNFNFNDIIFPTVILEENKMLAQLAQTPQESNADDFIVIQDSPIKCATIELKHNESFMKDIEKEKTRTPLGKNKKRTSNFIIMTNNTFTSPCNYNHLDISPKKKETSNMKYIRDEANKKNIIKIIKNEFDKEHELLLNEKKKLENAKWIAEIIHDTFIVEGTYTVIELNTFSKKIAEKYKSNKNFKMDENKITELIEFLPKYVPDINIKPSMMSKNKTNLSVKTKKNLFSFLEPLTLKINEIVKKYEELKNNKESRINELWKKHNVTFELNDKMKKYFLTPGSISLDAAVKRLSCEDELDDGSVAVHLWEKCTGWQK
ncbi:conserved Plasmodium protein, unknown function [Plasmodium ovale curtisi]|uniref:CDT1 Geminin-binding domain-containing protein n=1 Tax=Plasmodium ovale curtisi TaxID=864141 RepID=A0A1A8WXR6_PLAOA|nr:conserved Plasmodium protein, unknown function [Plasmodium ovale curtisi]